MHVCVCSQGRFLAYFYCICLFILLLTYLLISSCIFTMSLPSIARVSVCVYVCEMCVHTCWGGLRCVWVDGWMWRHWHLHKFKASLWVFDVPRGGRASCRSHLPKAELPGHNTGSSFWESHYQSIPALKDASPLIICLGVGNWGHRSPLKKFVYVWVYMCVTFPFEKHTSGMVHGGAVCDVLCAFPEM